MFYVSTNVYLHVHFFLIVTKVEKDEDLTTPQKSVSVITNNEHLLINFDFAQLK